MSEKMSAEELANAKRRIQSLTCSPIDGEWIECLLRHISTLQREADGMREALKDIEAGNIFGMSTYAAAGDFRSIAAAFQGVARAALNVSPQRGHFNDLASEIEATLQPNQGGE